MKLRWMMTKGAMLFVFFFVGQVLVMAQENSPEQKPGYDKSKDVGVKAPENADVPFDGSQKSLEANWEMWPKPEMPITWSLVDNPTGQDKVLMTNGGKRWGTHDLVTQKKYTDFECHVDFVMMGPRGDDKAEGYANSGVYLQNRYEMQIESPKGKNAKAPYEWKIGPHGIGAFCMERVPDVNAWRPNGQWQSFHFLFTAAKWEGNKALEPARVTVWWNGVKIHNNVPIKHANGGVAVSPSPEGLKLQEHGQDVRFRNIWIVDRSAKQKNEMSKPDKIEIRQSMLGYRDTLLFYTLKKQRAILVVSIDNQDETFPMTGKLYQFKQGTTEEGLKKWINNQHSDGLFVDIPTPLSTENLPKEFCEVTATEQTGTSQNSGPRPGKFKDFKVTFAIKVQNVGKEFKLPAFTDTATVHVESK
ncbi:MAG: DUF1080 domain-containing protein [Mariniblastus sp.]|nr:DUF1080 domain-containing protein [Mariniblastus sp.]